MTAFPDLRDFRAETGGETLDLPVGGRTYRWVKDAVPIGAGLDLVRMREELHQLTQRIAAGDTIDLATEVNTPLLDPKRERAFMLELIGERQRLQMEADGVQWPELQHIGHTLLTWHLTGLDAAKVVWLEGRDPDSLEKAVGADAGPPSGRG